MARFDLEKWLGDPALVGARFESRDLRGVLGMFSSDTLKVPPGVAMVVHTQDGAARLIKENEEARGPFSAVAVKSGDFEVPFRVPKLVTADDLRVDFEATVELFVDTDDEDAPSDFAGVFLGEVQEAGLKEMARVFSPPLEEAVRAFACARKAEDLFRGGNSVDLVAALGGALKRDLFESGLTLSEIRSARFVSDDYEKVLGEKADAVMASEHARRLEIIRDAWVKDQKNEILSNREINDLMKALEHEGALKELERRKEKVLAEKELQALSEKAAEEKLELQARSVSNLMKQLEDAGFRNVFEKFAELAGRTGGQPIGVTGIDPRLHGVVSGRTRRVFCAIGKRVVAYRADSTSPAEAYDFQSGALGMLRSVTFAMVSGRPSILAGAQFGVYLLHLDGAGRPSAYTIPGAGENRGGVNSCAVFGNRLFATHSDFGLIAFDLGGETAPGTGTVIRRDLTAGAKTCRGACAGPLDRLIFSADRRVFALLRGSIDAEPTVFEGAQDSITSIAPTARSLFAGTEGGDILRWEFSDPEAQPRREIARRPDPVFMIKARNPGGRPSVVAGWKSYGVLTKALETEFETSYPCDVRIRWVDSGDDYVFGVDRDGRRLLSWEAGNPRARPMEIFSDDRIQDLSTWIE